MAITQALVGAVNPRLAQYTNAGLLALTILLLNYAMVAVLAVIIMSGCSTLSSTEVSYPITTGGEFKDPNGLTGVHTKWMIGEHRREGRISSGGVTTETTVDYCIMDTYHMATAPFPNPAFMTGPTSLGGLGQTKDTYVNDAYAGTNLAFELPCWSSWMNCLEGDTFDGNYANIAKDNLPCVDAATRRSDIENGYITQTFGEALAKQAWCSRADREKVADKVLELRSLKSGLFGDQNVDLYATCGASWWMAPAGVVDPLYTGARIWPKVNPETGQRNPSGAVHPVYTIHWNLTVTTATTTCPTFWAAFGNAFAFATQIEIALTLGIIFSFSSIGFIKPVATVVTQPVKGTDSQSV